MGFPLTDKIDWGALAQDMGLVHGAGAARSESAGSHDAREALDRILGVAAIRSSVDDYVACAPGAELARAVLWLMHSGAAMERCYEIFRESSDANRRRSAVELLRVVADSRALEWVPEFLNDPDEGVQNWGIGLVDQLLYAGMASMAQCEAVLALATKHANPDVRDMARSIRDEAQRNRGSSGPNSGGGGGDRRGGGGGGGDMRRQGGGGGGGGGRRHGPPRR